MRPPRFRVRTLLLAVIAAGLLVWCAMMGTRSYVFYRRAQHYGIHERGWRELAARGGVRAEFRRECADYFAQLHIKYRRAMWRPWAPVGPDPHAPGFDDWQEQEQRARATDPDSPASGTPTRGGP